MKTTALVWCVLALGSWAEAGEPPPLVLPDPGGTVVVSLRYEGGYRVQRPGDAPRLAVLADGTIRAAAGADVLTTTMDRTALMALLRFVVEEHAIFDFDEEAARRAVREQSGSEIPIVEDAADTVIEVTLKDRRKRSSFHALGWMAREFPQVKALQDLRAIERRLENLVQVVYAGGEDTVALLLAVANARLKEEEAATRPLGITDLVRTHRWPAGGVDLLFERATEEGTLRVRVDAPPSRSPVVSIEQRPAAAR